MVSGGNSRAVLLEFVIGGRVEDGRQAISLSSCQKEGDGEEGLEAHTG